MYNVCVLLVFESFSNSVLEKSIDFKEFENFVFIPQFIKLNEIV